jgi:hypothetical protein
MNQSQSGYAVKQQWVDRLSVVRRYAKNVITAQLFAGLLSVNRVRNEDRDVVDIFVVLEQETPCCGLTMPPAPLTILSLDRCEFEAGKYRDQLLILEWLL